MSKALPPQKSSEFFTDLAAKYGNIESLDGPTGNGYLGWIAFRLHGQRGELTKTSSGNWLDAKRTTTSPESICQLPRFWDSLRFQIVRPPKLFSPLHLALIVPFFLAGLLFSRMLQKLSERAVGISTLGVHLHKGQILILWDEIKEVRPLRILNIRSLWLIRESGEKTIMPWTSLERHSDLKAAVESFAPANHPIRKYLSLLRRT